MIRRRSAEAEAAASSETIRLGQEHAHDEPQRWGLTLILFMRLVGVLWMFQGLIHWRTILAGDVAFDALPTSIMGAVIFFAVIDLLAAVGMWLATPWGGVLWILAAIAHALITIALPDFVAGGRVVLAVDVALVVAYFVISWYAAQERNY